MYIYSNPHPKGKRVGDCVKRAIVLATGLDYMEVQRQLNAHKKVTGASVYNDNKNWKSFVENVLKAIPIKIEVIPGDPSQRHQLMQAFEDGLRGYTYFEK